jgi:hypothetical protein
MLNPSPFPPMSVRSQESNLPYAFHYFPLSVSRCPAEILTSHSVKTSRGRSKTPYQADSPRKTHPHPIHWSHQESNFRTKGVNRVRLYRSATCLMASAWVGYEWMTPPMVPRPRGEPSLWIGVGAPGDREGVVATPIPGSSFSRVRFSPWRETPGA